MIFNILEENPKSDEDEVSNEVLMHEPGSNELSLPYVLPFQKAVLLYPLSGQLCHLKW